MIISNSLSIISLMTVKDNNEGLAKIRGHK